jgi:PAS domain S-box-containing protein
MDINFISFHDVTEEATILYSSDSVTDVLGYNPEDVIGRSAFDFLHPDEIDTINRIYIARVQAQEVLTYCRYKHANGNYVDVEAIFHYCYDVVIVATSIRRPETERHHARAQSALTLHVIKPDGSLELTQGSENQQRIMNLQQERFNWDQSTRSPEPRFAVILNRFTRAFSILFVSRAANQMVGIQSDDALGESFFAFVDTQDQPRLREDLEIAKSTDEFVHICFNWCTRGQVVGVVEGIASYTSDGIVVVFRNCSKRSVD